MSGTGIEPASSSGPVVRERRPLITAAVCTRNRAEGAADVVRSILANGHTNFEVIVVDQSTDEATRTALAIDIRTERITYIRTSTVGLGTARNIALRAAGGQVVAFTDDDCLVELNWLTAVADEFEPHQRLGVTVCSVVGGAHDFDVGTIPAHPVTTRTVAKSPLRRWAIGGIGAGIAVRRDAVLSFGGFDEMLGPGAPFSSCDDWDMINRALCLGWWVSEIGSTAITHLGFRTREEFRVLARRDWIGIGAAYSKLLRCGQFRIMPSVIYHFVWVGLLRPLSSLARLQKPTGLRRDLYAWEGLRLSWRTPVDRRTLAFVAP
jgi:glycosyltransferase involved in cell wall biosynthesis